MFAVDRRSLVKYQGLLNFRRTDGVSILCAKTCLLVPFSCGFQRFR